MEVTYQGTPGHAVVRVESDDSGIKRAPLRHHVKHSPTGFSWGYGGSGPAELARCLLIDALGDRATCTTCRGKGRVAPDETLGNFRPVEPGDNPDIVIGCIDCEAGFGPEVERCYQAFKFEVVAAWPQAAPWSMLRAEIIAWHAQHESAVGSTRH